MKFVWVVMLGLVACTSPAKIPVQGRLGPYEIQTTVDSAEAKYFLEGYLNRRNPDSKKDAELRKVLKGTDVEDLKRLADATSVDLAALHFGHQLISERNNRVLQDLFAEKLKLVRQDGDGLSSLRSLLKKTPSSQLQIVFVPGYDYVDHGHATGANFSTQIRLLQNYGLETTLVPIDPQGSVEENARFLVDFLENSNRAKVLVGASSAGPAIHLALGELLSPEQTQTIKAWFNAGGILGGVPLVDWLDSGLRSWIFAGIMWWEDQDLESLRSMKRSRLKARFSRLQLPEHLLHMSYVGLSLSGDISLFARDQYLLMRSDGPNDGLSLLPDLLTPSRLAILAPKSDHFFAEDPETDQKSLAILLVIFDLLDGKVPDVQWR